MSHHTPKLAALAVTLALSPQIAAAEISLPVPGLSLSGDINYEFVKLESDKHSNLNTDVTLSWRPMTGDALTLGLDLSHVSNYSVWANKVASSYWGGLVVGFAGAEMVIGAARPITDQMQLLPLVGSNEIVQNMSRVMHASGMHMVTAISPNGYAPGLSIRSTGEGDLQWGVSVHKAGKHAKEDDYLEDYDFTFVEAAANYTMGNLTLGAQLVHSSVDGLEIYFGGEGSETYTNSDHGLSVLATARYAMENWVIGFNLGRSEFWGDGADFARLHGSYDFGNGFTLSGDYLEQKYLDGGERARVFNLSAEYALSNGLYLKAATFKTSEVDTPYHSLTAGYRF